MSRTARLAPVARVAILAIAGWLLWSAILKLVDGSAFRASLRAQDLLPPATLPAVACAVPCVELILAGWAILDAVAGSPRLRVPALALAVLFLVFAAYAAVLTFRPPPKPTGCGCGWSRAIVTDWRPIAARNAGLAVVLALGAWAVGARRSAGAVPAPA